MPETRCDERPRVARTRNPPRRLYVITYERMAATAEPAAPHRRSARARPARGDGPLPARPRRAQRRLGADALPGRAGRDEPDAADRRRIAAGLELRLSQLLRLDEEGTVTVVRRRGAPPRRRRRPRLRGPHPAAARPARRGLAPHARARRQPPAAPATRRCTSPARARPRWSSRARSTLLVDGARHELRTRRLRDLRRRPAAPLREPREGGGRPARRRVGGAPPLMTAPSSTRSGPRTRWRRACSTSTCTSCTR